MVKKTLEGCNSCIQNLSSSSTIELDPLFKTVELKFFKCNFNSRNQFSEKYWVKRDDLNDFLFE